MFFKQIAVALDKAFQQEEDKITMSQGTVPVTLEGTSLERFLLKNFPQLQELKNLAQARNGVDRYHHTLIMLVGLMALRTNNYDLFVRHDSEQSKGQKLTEDQFMDMYCKTSEILDSPEAVRFMLLAITTHDYGVIKDEKAHVTYSGWMCVEDFQRAGFSADDVVLAQLIIGNHDSLGSMFLGEVSPDHVEKIYRRAQKYRSEVRFFQYLWLLTMLDINGSGTGYLTKEKYDQLGSLHIYESFNRLTQVWPEMRIKLLRQFADVRGERVEEVKRFYRVNMQYLFKLVTYKDSASGQTVVSEENFWRLIKILNILWDRVRQLNGSGISPQINYITFSSDERSAAIELNEKLATVDFRKEPRLGYPKGSCQIYDYEVVDDYLIILNGQKK